jgi:hypothetical protein
MRSVVLFVHGAVLGMPLRAVLSVSCRDCGAGFKFAGGDGAICFNDERTELSAWIEEEMADD